MANKIFSFLSLIRISKPNGIYLLYLPCAFGILLGTKENQYPIYYLFIFFLGSFLMRSAGCIINDLWDRNIDKLVDRTKNRPIACGLVSETEALIYLFFLLSLSLVILLQLPILAQKISLFSMILVVTYPLMKRFTFYPQLFLGVTYNLGVIIGFITTNGTINSAIFIAYLGFIFWTLTYDTIYGFLDIEDDKKIAVKSLSILLEKRNYKIYFSIFSVVFISLSSLSQFLIKPGLYIFMNFISLFLFLTLIYFLNINSKQLIFKAFNFNSIIVLLMIIFQFFSV